MSARIKGHDHLRRMRWIGNATTGEAIDWCERCGAYRLDGGAWVVPAEQKPPPRRQQEARRV